MYRLQYFFSNTEHILFRIGERGIIRAWCVCNLYCTFPDDMIKEVETAGWSHKDLVYKYHPVPENRSLLLLLHLMSVYQVS